MNQFRPMLAESVTDLESLRYPLLASPKFDGIRGIVNYDGDLISRKLKMIPNDKAQTLFGDLRLIGCDGELIAGDPTAPDCLRHTTSAVMGRGADVGDLRFYVFDSMVNPGLSYTTRYKKLQDSGIWSAVFDVHLVEQKLVRNVEDVMLLEERLTGKGYEGIMLRCPHAPYKFGRSTLREQYLLKLKRFKDAEAVIVATEELYTNTNELQRDERGYAKRSSAKAGKVGAGTLGRFLVEDIHNGNKFFIGTGLGLTQALRAELWKNRRSLAGKIIKYRYQEVGVKDLPRFPRFIGFRDKRDM